MLHHVCNLKSIGSSCGWAQYRWHAVRSTQYLFFIAAGLTLTISQSHLRGDDTAAASNNDAIAPKNDVIRLFDGKSLGDCYTWLKDSEREDPRKVFRVEDGMIHVTSDGLGGLVTNKRYRDYHLVL